MFVKIRSFTVVKMKLFVLVSIILFLKKNNNIIQRFMFVKIKLFVLVSIILYDDSCL